MASIVNKLSPRVSHRLGLVPVERLEGIADDGFEIGDLAVGERLVLAPPAPAGQRAVVMIYTPVVEQARRGVRRVRNPMDDSTAT